MLTKGIVEEIITPYKVKVRLPIFDGIEGTRNATETNELSEAIICSLPNSSNLVNIGDIVIIGFEDNDTSKPIILGHLFKENDNSTLVNLKVGALETTGVTKLSKDTHIGEVKPKEIEALSGISSNIQGQIDNLNNQAERLLNNPNLLINGDFRTNQRGQTSYTVDNKYTVDRWLNREASMSVTPLTNGGIKLERTATAVTAVPMISQSLEMFENLLGKTLTLTIKVSEDNTVNGFEFGLWGGTQARYATKDYGSSVYLKGIGIHTVTLTLPTSVDYERLNVCIRLKQDSSQGENIVVDWVKLEIGSIATPFSPRPYAEELALCQRYTIVDNEWRTAYNRCGIGAAGSATEVFIALPIPVSLRTKPTMYYKEGDATPTTTKPALLRLLSYSGGALAAKDTTSLVVAKLNAGEMLIQVKSSGLTIGHIQNLYYASSGILQIIYDAEIY